MALKVICGPAGSGKTERAMQAYLAAADCGDDPIFIAPSGPDARHFQRELLRLRPVLSGKQATTLGNLARDIFRRAGFEMRVLEEVERKLLLRSVVDNTDELTFLKGSSVYPGFIDSLARLIAELQGACIAPEELAKNARGILQEKLNNDLFRIYNNYRVTLSEQQVTDEELAQCQAVESLLADASLLEHRVVIMDGFSDLTPIEHSLVAVLVQTADEVLLTVPFEEGVPATISVGRNFAELMEAGGCEQLSPPAADSRPGPLVHMDRSLFGGPGEMVDGDGSVRLLEGAGSRGESTLIAAEILRLYRQGTPLDEIAVVCRSLGPEATAVRRAFSDMGIPCELNAPIALVDTPLGQTLTSLLDFLHMGSDDDDGAVAGEALEGDVRSSLLGYLRSSLPVADVDQVDLFARTAGLLCLEDTGELMDTWERLGGRQLSEVDDIRSAAGAGVSQLGAALSGLASRLVSAGVAESDRLGVGDIHSRETDLQALDMVRKVCKQAASIVRGESAPAKVLDLLRSGLRAASFFPSAGRLRNCVRILDPHRVLNQKFDIVFICGLLEGHFPFMGGEEPFITDDDRARLTRKGLALKGKADRLDDERFLFYRALTRARETVYLSYPYCSSEGKERVRSLFVEEVLELVDVGTDYRRELKITDVAFQTGEAPSVPQALRSLCLVAGRCRDHEGKLGEPERQRLEAAAGHTGLSEAFGRCMAAAEPLSVVINAPEIRAEFERMSEFHTTKLERYGKCPYGYLVDEHMQPALMEIDDFHMERGTVAHKVLARLIMQTRSHVKICEADEAQLAALNEKMEQLIDEQIEERNLTDCVDGQLMAVTLKRHLRDFIEREHACFSKFEPESTEFPFEHISLGEGITLSGRIDRVDREPGSERALVIDYKTGKNAHTWRKYNEEMLLQIPLYMYALQHSGMKPIGGEYYALLSGDRRGIYLEQHARELGRELTKGDLVSTEQFDQVIKQTLELARSLAAGIRSLDFDVEPLKGACEYCGFATICRYSGTGTGKADG